jgi:hypothetical protein
MKKKTKTKIRRTHRSDEVQSLKNQMTELKRAHRKTMAHLSQLIQEKQALLDATWHKAGPISVEPTAKIRYAIRKVAETNFTTVLEQQWTDGSWHLAIREVE